MKRLYASLACVLLVCHVTVLVAVYFSQLSYPWLGHHRPILIPSGNIQSHCSLHSFYLDKVYRTIKQKENTIEKILFLHTSSTECRALQFSAIAVFIKNGEPYNNAVNLTVFQKPPPGYPPILSRIDRARLLHIAPASPPVCWLKLRGG